MQPRTTFALSRQLRFSRQVRLARLYLDLLGTFAPFDIFALLGNFDPLDNFFHPSSLYSTTSLVQAASLGQATFMYSLTSLQLASVLRSSAPCNILRREYGT